MWRYYLWVLVFFGLSVPLLHATHNRAGEITYEQIGPNTIRMKITTYTKISGQSIHADRSALTVNWGDGQTELIQRDNFVDIYTDIRRNEYIGTHTYPGPNLPGQPYIVSMQDPNRNENIHNINGGNSVNVEFYLQTEVFLFSPAVFGNNSSPILLEPPIDFGVIGQTFQHTPNGYDPDGDSVAYELITPFSGRGTAVPGYRPVSDINPGPNNQFTFDELTGLFTWTSPQRAGEYNIAILVKSFRNGQYLGGIVRDIQIEIRNAQNTPPDLETPLDLCVWAGQLIEFDVTASDSDLPNQVITLTGTGGPLILANSPATFNNQSGLGPLTSRFRWQTTCDHVQDQPYQLVFKARDTYFQNNLDASLATFKVVRIRVLAPPVENLTANVSAGNIILTWDAPYVCDNTAGFFGFTVWRKELCDATVLDSCTAGGMQGLGYTRINPSLIRTPQGNVYQFVDNTTSRGALYSYRVLGEFGTPVYSGTNIVNFHSPVSSAGAQEVCVQMARDLPLMTNVDINSTQTSNGEIFVQWSKPNPEQLDTTQNQPPYRYELYRSLDGTGGSFEVNPIFTSPNYTAFHLAVDTNFTDVAAILNTEGQPYSYRVAFYANGDTLGFTSIASSVFLQVSSTDQRNDLSWSYNVPWNNQKFVVFLESPTGSNNFQVLDTVEVREYSHSGLVNGQTYCYYIESIGTYGLTRVLDPLLNKSQKACGVPLDTIAPCPPRGLAAIEGCLGDVRDDVPEEDLFNQIRWNKAPDSCAADAAKFRVYFSPYCTGDYSLVAESSNLADTFFLHQPSPNNLAGCYYVTTVDSIQVNGGGNESLPSEVVRTDNCPIYNLPNVFTPNGDGQNERFRPFLPYRYIQKVDFRVFNRWGQQIFATEDPMLNWDGTDQNTGKELAEGVYYYTCQVFENRLAGPISRKLEGYIHVIRGAR